MADKKPINKLKANIGPLHDFDFIPIWDPTVGEEERITVFKLREHILSGVTFDGTDTYTTGATYSSGIVYFSTNKQTNAYTLDLTPLILSGGSSLVTGFTYNSSFNKLTIRQTNLPDLDVFINQFSGITVTDTAIINNTETNSLSVYGNIETVDYIQFNDGYTGNTIVAGRLYWDTENGTLSLGMRNSQVLQQIGQEIFYQVKNQSGTTIQNGRVVRAAGTLGASGRILAEYMIADGTIPQKYTLGIATEDILNGDDGYVTEFGLVRGIDATGSPYGETWSDGDVLWVHPTIPGGLTNVQPIPPQLKIEIAMVIHNTANGSIFVRPHRYPHIHDLQDVAYSANTESNFDILQWDDSSSGFVLTKTPTFLSVSAVTYYGDGSNLTGVSGLTDNYVTDASLSGNVLTLTRTSPLSALTVDLSGLVTSGGTGGGYKSYVLTSGSTYQFSTPINTLIINKTISSPTLVLLPTTPITDNHYIVTDRKGDSWRYPITVSGGTYLINGHSDCVIKIKNNPSLTFLYNGFEYVII